MFRKIIKGIFVTGVAILPLSSNGQSIAVSSEKAIPQTLLNESKASVQRGIDFLSDSQQENGSWLNSAAITALVCISLQDNNTGIRNSIRLQSLAKGRAFILKFVQKNGVICEPGSRYINYTTAICLSALALMDKKEDVAIMRKARHFLIDSQLDEDHKDNPTDKDNAFHGGIGYGSGGPTVPDLSNTQWALEALYLTNHLDEEGGGATNAEIKKSKLAWKNAIAFISRVQNMPESSDDKWVVSEKFDGGFGYQPGYSKVNDKLDGADGAASNNLGQVHVEGLRSYGAMTYAGLKSMIYANIPKDDHRIKAVMDWTKLHYTLDENPVMGPEGHFYYLHTFAKACAVMGEETITTTDGKVHYWRIELIKKLLSLQQGNGSWINSKSGRWQESIPEMVTAYALSAMKMAKGSQD